RGGIGRGGAGGIAGGAGLPAHGEPGQTEGWEMTPAAIPGIVHDLFAHMPMVQRLSLAAIGVGALLLMVLERVIPYNKGQKFLREGFFDDFAMYTIAQNYVLSIVIFSIIIARVDTIGGFFPPSFFLPLPPALP